jgi:hypothetical protein
MGDTFANGHRPWPIAWLSRSQEGQTRRLMPSPQLLKGIYHHVKILFRREPANDNY